MPTYEYQCTNCGYKFSKMINPSFGKYSVESLTPCPQCDEIARKKFSVPNIIVK